MGCASIIAKLFTLSLGRGPLKSDSSVRNESSNMSGIGATFICGSIGVPPFMSTASGTPVKSVTGGSFEVPNAISNAFVGSLLIWDGGWCSCNGCDCLGVSSTTSVLVWSVSRFLKLKLNSLLELVRMLWKNLTIFFNLHA